MDIRNNAALPGGDGAEGGLNGSIKALATLIAQLQRHEYALEEGVRQQLRQLHSAVADTDRRVHLVVEGALPRLTQLSQQALSAALDPAARRFERTLAATNEALQQATQRHAQAQRSLESTVMRRMWIGSIAMMVAAVMGLGAVAYALHGARGTLAEAEQRRAETAYLDRVARTKLIPCGEGRLCAEVERNSKRYGERGQYRVLTLREPPAR